MESDVFREDNGDEYTSNESSWFTDGYSFDVYGDEMYNGLC